MPGSDLFSINVESRGTPGRLVSQVRRGWSYFYMHWTVTAQSNPPLLSCSLFFQPADECLRPEAKNGTPAAVVRAIINSAVGEGAIKRGVP